VSNEPASRPGATSPRGMGPAILALFILSGAAGLVYEVVWARQLVLVFGNTTQAVSAILTGFFGGMAIGSLVGGRVADRVRSPLRMYGILELILVIVVVATPISFRLIHELYRGAYGALEDSPAIVTLVRFALALLALAPATILMGATLPALTRYLTRGPAHLSRAFSRLYAANTVGAIVGTLAAGLVLIELFGLSGALLIGAACSGTAGLLAVILASRFDRVLLARRDQAPADTDARVASSPPPVPSAGRPRLAIAVAFASGLTSLGYQVLWTRLLASGSGNSTYVFTAILAVFLTGIAIGAVLFALIRSRLRDPVAFLAGTQLVVALVVIYGLVVIIAKPPVLDAGRPLDAVWLLLQSVAFVVLPATLVMGLSFPASSALLPAGEGHAGRETGQLLAANTIGAITGSFAVPFFVIPFLGSPLATAALAGVNVAIGLALALVGGVRNPARRLRLGVVGLLCAATVLAAVYRPGAVVDPTSSRIAYVGGRVFATDEDEIAAVQAGQVGPTPQLWVTGTSMTVLTIDANLMPILPLIARPDADDALVVAFGMGSSFRTAVVAGLNTEVIELVPSVPGMFQWFHADADEVRTRPNGRIIVADGRNHLELTDRSYDIIVTDPPPPIESSGASVISSLEYYRAGRARLNPGGVMMQWAPFSTDAADLPAHLRTFRAVFPNVVVLFGPGRHGIFMLGSDEPIALDEAAIRDVLGRPGVLDNLSEPFDTPATTIDQWVLEIPQLVWLDGVTSIDARAGSGPLVTDDRPYSEYFLLRRLFEGTWTPPEPMT
jgi:spermidine synthase